MAHANLGIEDALCAVGERAVVFGLSIGDVRLRIQRPPTVWNTGRFCILAAYQKSRNRNPSLRLVGPIGCVGLKGGTQPIVTGM